MGLLTKSALAGPSIKLMSSAAATLVAGTYFEAFRACNGDETQLGTRIPIPVFSENLIKGLCKDFVRSNSGSKSVIQISTNHVHVVGDLHGNIHNLFIIFEKFGYPPMSRYLFLGNMVEFGEFSLEVITLLIALQIKYPQSIFLLKGISEAYSLNIFRGLHFDIDYIYHDSFLYEFFLQVFSKLPIGALVFGDVLCTQPCWLDKFKDIDQLKDKKIFDAVKRDEEAYNFYANMCGKIDESDIKFVVDSLDINYIIFGSCSESKYYDAIGEALFISAANSDYGCVIPLVLGSSSEVQFFSSSECVERKSCKLVNIRDKPISICTKGKIRIPQVLSRPKVLDTSTSQIYLKGVQKWKSTQDVFPSKYK